MKTLKFLTGTTVALLFGAAFISPAFAQTNTRPETDRGTVENNSIRQNDQQPGMMNEPAGETTGETGQNQTIQQQRTGGTTGESTQLRRQTQTIEQRRTVETQPTQMQQTGQDNTSPTPSTNAQEEQPVRGLW